MCAQPECPLKMQSSSIVSLVNVHIFLASTFTSVPVAKVQVTPTHTFPGCQKPLVYNTCIYGRTPSMACATDCLPVIVRWSKLSEPTGEDLRMRIFLLVATFYSA